MKYTEEDIKPFLDACEDMIKSKFILIDKRVSNILKSIATTKPVYNAIAEAMINFNWESAFKYATQKNGELVMPEDQSKLIAFVFCLLKNIDGGKVNVNDLLVRYCSKDEEKRSNYVVFCEKTILPFMDIIKDRLVGAKSKAEVVVQPKEQINADVNNRLAFLVKDVKAYVDGIKKIGGSISTKQDYIALTDAFLEMIKDQLDKYYLAVAKTLLTLSGRDKELKNRINSIIELIAHIKE